MCELFYIEAFGDIISFWVSKLSKPKPSLTRLVGKVEVEVVEFEVVYKFDAKLCILTKDQASLWFLKRSGV